MNETIQASDVDQLNSFLRGELSAVETYELALEKVDHPKASSVLRENLDSHAGRVTTLTAAIERTGGRPVADSGAWGSFAKAVEAGAALFGESAAVRALEAGESHGLRDYEGDMGDLSAEARQLVAHKLLREQHRTHGAIERLRAILD